MGSNSHRANSATNTLGDSRGNSFKEDLHGTISGLHEQRERERLLPIDNTLSDVNNSTMVQTAPVNGLRSGNENQDRERFGDSSQRTGEFRTRSLFEPSSEGTKRSRQHRHRDTQDIGSGLIQGVPHGSIELNEISIWDELSQSEGIYQLTLQS